MRKMSPFLLHLLHTYDKQASFKGRKEEFWQEYGYLRLRTLVSETTLGGGLVTMFLRFKLYSGALPA